MTQTFRISYRHSQTTAKPHYVGARDVADVARSLRHQLGYGNGRTKVDHREVVERVRRLDVNGVRVDVEWGLDAPVTDEQGKPALGSCEYDLGMPEHALVYVNMQEIGGRDYLERSTGLHELGHGIFDAPAWIVANKQGRLDLGGAPGRGTRVFRIVTPGEEHLRNSRTADGPMEWQEFRANEFMGAFLAPEDLLRRALFRLCKRMWVPLVEEREPQQGLPGLDLASPVKADFAGSGALKFEPAVYELAEEFGLSPSFIQVRVKKYGLIRGLPG